MSSNSPSYIREFIHEIYGDYKELAMDSFSEKDCIVTATELIKELKHFRSSCIGLWCTDKPEVIPNGLKHLFFELTQAIDRLNKEE